MRAWEGKPETASLAAFELAVQDSRPVTGLTHPFYRYPARFSPIFARAAIEAFTEPGDLVVDPFMGGGTTLVEARVLGRHSIGADISYLARFVAKLKVTALSSAELAAVSDWVDATIPQLNIHAPPILGGWPQHLGARRSWRIGKLIGLALGEVSRMRSAKARDFARGLVLKTGQWALDGRSQIPTVDQFRTELRRNLQRMTDGMKEFCDATATNCAWAQCFVSPAEHLHRHRIWRGVGSPRLILTSPPYAGVHVVYARWQILGRRETPAPFWIANSLDGHGQAHYTFGDRHSQQSYFTHAAAAFRGLARIAGPDTLMVQLMGFARPQDQLPLYLRMLEESGFEEVDLGFQERLWRQVPNRKWHADQRGETAGSREVVLVHRLRS